MQLGVELNSHLAVACFDAAVHRVADKQNVVFAGELSTLDHFQRFASGGLGHRVYKSYDPRAAIARKYLEKIMEREDTQKLPSDERALFAVATELEDIALNDEYFVSRNLYPNVDFYTGLIYRAIGFDPAMFTTLFALGRIPGWIAQYREMLADPNTKIGRPRQVYTGPVERDFVPMDER